MTAHTHRKRATLAAAIAVMILLLGFAAGWVGKIAADDRAQQATSAAKAVAGPVVEKCESNTPQGKVLRDEGRTCEQARQVQKAVESDRAPVLVPVPGADGADGAPGPAGPRGFIGPVGPTGDPGKNGENGANGSDGQNGVDGLAGADGTSGTDGQAGSNGNDGQNGTDGQNATDQQVANAVAEFCTARGDCIGKDGQDGAAGPAGPAGPPGVVATATSPGCSSPNPVALMTFNLVYDSATQTITLVCERS